MASRSQILSDNQTSFPNNNSALITPEVLRDFNADFANSVVFNDQTGSMSVANAVSASFALTASFALNAGSTINTGSFATTGSNTFTGVQTFNANTTFNATPNFNRPVFIGDILSFTASRFSPTIANSADLEMLDQNRFGFNVKDLNAVTSGSDFTATVNSGSLFASVDFNTYYGGKIGILRLRNDNGNRSLFADVDTTFITGSTTITSLTGSLQGTASFATTASFALNAGTTVNTGSLLTTASVSLNTITFTKGDGSTFPITVNTGSGGTINTGSFATTGSNTFIGSQTITGSISATGNIITDGSLRSGQFNTFTGSQLINGSTFQTGSIDVTNSVIAGGNIIATGSLRSNAGNTFVGNQEITGSTFQSGSTFQTGSISATGNGVFGGSLRSGTANTFTGSQNISGSTFQSGSLQLAGALSINSVSGTGTGEAIILGRTGSLILGTSSTNASYAGIQHMTMSSPFPGFQTNLIFKNNNNTVSTIISGSDSLLSNPAAAAAGFTRFVGQGGGNIFIGSNGTNIPSRSGSMAFVINMDNNYSVGNLTMRGPVSSSAWTISSNNTSGNVNIGQTAALHAQGIVSGLSFTQNNIAGTLNLIANSGSLSSSVVFTSNNINGSTTFRAVSSSLSVIQNTINDSQFIFQNNYFSTTQGVGRPAVTNNTISGFQNSVTITGSMSASLAFGPSISDNAILGTYNRIFIDASTSASGSTPRFSADSNIIGGSNLIITGSSSLYDLKTAGSAFFGRYNLNDGILNTTSDTVFAVGAGTSEATRKTSLHISSSGLTSVRDSLNVTGSLIVGVTTPELRVLSTGVTLGNVVTDTHTITGSLSISGSLTVNGNLQYNVGAFFSTASQSGSAGVSQSMTFDTTDISNGVSIVSGSRITLANAGTYNIQFSAQVLADAGADDIAIWLKKNGTNVSNSAGKLALANNEEQIASWNYVANAIANDYYEIAYQTLNGDAILLYEAASGNIPAIPSIILTVTQNR
jgi:hypothetical protein